MASQSLLAVLRTDDSLPIAQEARDLWLKDMRNPLRMFVLPVCRAICSLQLHTTYFIKRLLPFQFRAHNFLQGMICWFMKWWITPEANVLILRHYTTESNIINFLIANSEGVDVKPLELYPKTISDMMRASLVDHDQVNYSGPCANWAGLKTKSGPSRRPSSTGPAGGPWKW